MRRVGVLSLACVTAVLVSSELALSLPILGVGPDLILITLIAFTAGERQLPAASVGFGTGLFRDLLLVSPAGPSAFAYGLTAFTVASAGAVRGVWAFLGLVCGATVLSQVVYGLATQVLSPAASGAPLPRVIFGVTLYNAMLTPLLMPVLRRFATADQPIKEAGTA